VIEADQEVGALGIKGRLVRRRRPARRRAVRLMRLGVTGVAPPNAASSSTLQILAHGAADCVRWQALLARHRSLPVDIGTD